jgi:hypothetical protein
LDPLIKSCSNKPSSLAFGSFLRRTAVLNLSRSLSLSRRPALRRRRMAAGTASRKIDLLRLNTLPEPRPAEMPIEPAQKR